MMKQYQTKVMLVGLETKTFNEKSRSVGYFSCPLENKEDGYRCFSINLDDDDVIRYRKIGFNKLFDCVFAENKRVARSSGQFADYINEFSLIPLV